MSSKKLPAVFENEFSNLSSKAGNVERKVQLVHQLSNHEEIKNDVDGLYHLWLDLFKKDPLPIAWTADQATESNSSIYKMMKGLGFSSYSDFHSWSVKNKDEFWKKAIAQLGIKFRVPYTKVLDLKKGVEDPTWLYGAKMNIVESCFLAEGTATAIIQGSEDKPIQKITFKELNKLVNKIASGLYRQGLVTGDAIVLYMPLTIESIATYLAIVKSGMAVVSVADSFSPTELKKRIEITKAKAIITCDGYLYGGKVIDVFSKVQEANAPKAIVADYTGKRKLRSEYNDLAFEDLLAQDQFPYYYADPDATTNILFSSGTTKEPKAIPWTHITPLKCAADGLYHQNIKVNDVVTWTTGMGWMMAPWLIYASLINQATIAIFTGAATSEKFGKFVEEAQVSVLGTIPSVVKGWKAQEFHKKFHWESVKLYSSTGEPSNQEDYFYLMSLSRFKAPIIEYCGGTEIGGGYITGTVVQPASPATFTTPALGMGFYLLKGDLKPAIAGEQGEVFIVPPSIGLTQKLLNKNHHEEYYENVPKGSKGEVLRKHGDAFDIIQMENHVFYRSIGRVDDAMNLGGIKVSAVEIEFVLNKHESLVETAAISVPGEGGGPEKLIVFYQPHKDVIDLEVLKKELQTLITKELNPLFRISEIIEKKVLPRTASNKLMRRELRKDYMEKK
jgi:acetyl-CoA synthetase